MFNFGAVGSFFTGLPKRITSGVNSVRTTAVKDVTSFDAAVQSKAKEAQQIGSNTVNGVRQNLAIAGKDITGFGGSTSKWFTGGIGTVKKGLGNIGSTASKDVGAVAGDIAKLNPLSFLGKIGKYALIAGLALLVILGLAFGAKHKGEKRIFNMATGEERRMHVRR